MRIYASSGNTTWPNPELQFTSRLRKNTTKYSVLGQYLLNTPPTSFFEEVVVLNSEEVLYNKIHEAPRSPHKVVLRRALPEGRKNTSNTDGRKSSATSGKHRETCCCSDEGDTLPKIDYRNQGLLHSTVKQENYTRKEVVKKLIHHVETHPYRDALKADLKQNQAYNPFSEKNEEHDPQHGECGVLRNVRDLFQNFSALIVWRTGRKVSCAAHAEPACISQRKREKLNGDRFDALSTPHYVIKKGPLRGACHGDTGRQRIYHAAHVAAKKARKRGYNSILDQFQRCSMYRESQLAIGWDEDFCAHYDGLPHKDHTCFYTASEHQRLENSWVLALNSQGPNGLMKQREDYAEAVRIKERLRRESGWPNPKIHPSKHVSQRANQPFLRSSEGAERFDPTTGWKWCPSTTSSSFSSTWRTSTNEWWQASSWDAQWFFCLSRSCRDFACKQWRFAVTDGRCEPHTTIVYTCTFRLRELFLRGSR